MSRRRFPRLGAACVALTVTGCIRPYDTEPLTPSDSDRAAASKFTYELRNPRDKVNLVNDEWVKIQAKCVKVRAAMQHESDSIASKNAVTGAVFAATTAGLALASGLYTTAKGDRADPAVSAGLALGASATAVPTFFYFGSDEREKVVNARIAVIDGALDQVNEAWNQFNSADTVATGVMEDEDVAQAEYNRVSGGQMCEELKTDPQKQQCGAARALLLAAKATTREKKAAWHAATNALDRSVQVLILKCR